MAIPIPARCARVTRAVSTAAYDDTSSTQHVLITHHWRLTRRWWDRCLLLLLLLHGGRSRGLWRLTTHWRGLEEIRGDIARVM